MSFDSDRTNYYLVAKGARDVALAETNCNHFNKKVRGCFKISKKVFFYKEFPDIPQYVIYVKGRSDAKANLLLIAAMNRDHRAVGILLGYTPELVEEFMGFYESTENK